MDRDPPTESPLSLVMMIPLGSRQSIGTSLSLSCLNSSVLPDEEYQPDDGTKNGYNCSDNNGDNRSVATDRRRGDRSPMRVTLGYHVCVFLPVPCELP